MIAALIVGISCGAGLMIYAGFQAADKEGRAGAEGGGAAPLVAKIGESFPVSRRPHAVATGLGSVWVVSSLDRTLSRIDPLSGDVVHIEILEAKSLGDVAVGSKEIWVSDPVGSRIFRIDPIANEVDLVHDISIKGDLDIEVANPAGSPETVWVNSTKTKMIEAFVPDLGKSFVHPRRGWTELATDGGSVWAVHGQGGELVELTTESSEEVISGGWASIRWDDLAVGSGQFWYSQGPLGALSNLAQSEVEGIELDGRSVKLALDRRYLWALVRSTGRLGWLSQIDRASGKIVGEPLILEGAPRRVATGFGSVWVTLAARSEVARLDLLPRPAETPAGQTDVFARVPLPPRPISHCPGSFLVKRWVGDKQWLETYDPHGLLLGRVASIPRGHVLRDAVWSPLGEQIAYVLEGPAPGSDIYVADVPTGRVRRLTHDAAREHSLAWSPDGHRIAFLRVALGVGTREIFVVDLATRTLSRLASGSDPDWSPDGTALTYATGQEMSPQITHSTIHIVDSDGERKITMPEAADDSVPDWSPDGKSILFHRRFHDAPEYYDSAQQHLYAVDPTTGEETRLTGILDGPSAIWSPDGSRIVVSDYWEGEIEVFQMRSDGSHKKGIAHPGKGAMSGPLSITWTRDGSRIARFVPVYADFPWSVTPATGAFITRMTCE